MFIFRNPSKQGAFRSYLRQSCDHLRSLQLEVFDPAAHVLSLILEEHFTGWPACTIKEVIEMSKKLDHPLPHQASRLSDLSVALSSRTKILFLTNHEKPERSWIVLDVYAVLQNINKAPTRKILTFGVAQWSQLYQQEYSDFDPTLLGYLVLSDTDVCRVSTDIVAPDVDKDSPVGCGHSISKEKYVFSPGLSPGQHRGSLWTSGVFKYYFGWCLRCVDDKHFFSIQFVHTLLFELSLIDNDHSLWENGIRWLDLRGIETIVEIVEDCKAVLVLIRMKEDSIVSGLPLRTTVIRKVLDTKEEYCENLSTSEYVIDPCHLQPKQSYPVITQPLSELVQYDMALIATAICSDCKSFV